MKECRSSLRMTNTSFITALLALIASAGSAYSQAAPGSPSSPPVPAARQEQQTTPQAEAKPETPGTVAPAVPADYVLAVSDIVDVVVFREPDLSTRARIANDGSVQLPLIGEMKIGGMTVRAAREAIRKRYDAEFLVDPQIALNVAGYALRKFTILGQVAKPGTFEFPGGETLSLPEAIGMAGGYTRIADRGKVTVKRTEGGVKTLKVNTKKADKDGKEFQVLPGDVITVGESWF
jgi:protein involved in polysaccharide export with SLBB domain